MSQKKLVKKRKQLAAQLAVQSRVGNLTVLIELRTANIPLTSDKKVLAKRKQLSSITACAMTIHKSSGGTFHEIVYEYSRGHPQELIHVAQPRVATIEGLFIVRPDERERERE